MKRNLFSYISLIIFLTFTAITMYVSIRVYEQIGESFIEARNSQMKMSNQIDSLIDVNDSLLKVISENKNLKNK